MSAIPENTEAPPAGAAAFRNPRDSMKSTWQKSDRSTWTIAQRRLNRLFPVDDGRKVPVFQKSDPVPYVPQWRFHVWILLHALLPIAVQQAYVWCFAKNPHAVGIYLIYAAAIIFNSSRSARQTRELGFTYGWLDGDKNPRDGVPDVAVQSIFWGTVAAMQIRPMLVVMLSYGATQLPSSINIWLLPVEIGLANLCLDFWFYWYHRLMHELPFLWKFHRTHHLTKHPNSALTLYADHVQEVFDVVIIPSLGFFTMRALGFPMGFYETWICHQYLLFTESLGHSGLRVYAAGPSTLSMLWRYLGVEGIIEDHDLHHRTGWKKSHSYGKHQGLWDVLFGTNSHRLECKEENIDWNNPVKYPLF